MNQVRSIFIFFFLCVYNSVNAQDYLSYQSILLDQNGPILNKNITLHLSISQGNDENGIVIYKESHENSTDESGLITLSLGSGFTIQGNWSSIDWSLENLYLTTYLIEGEVPKLINSSKINFSPKSMYANQAKSVFDNSITTDKIRDGAITADKLAEGVLPPAMELTKEAIVALGIPEFDTNTTYSAGTGIEISHDTISVSMINTDNIVDFSITTDKIRDGVITADKLAEGVLPPTTELTKEAIVALGIPEFDTNTTYSAGTGIEISNDTISVSSNIIRADENNIIESNGLVYRKQPNTSTIPDLRNYQNQISFFEDYAYFMGQMDTISRLFIEQIITDEIESNKINTESLQFFSNEQNGNLLVSSGVFEDQPELNVGGAVRAERFIGNGSLLTNLPEVSLNSNNYLPFSGLFIEKPELEYFTSFRADVEEGLLNDPLLSDSGLNNLSNFSINYLGMPSQEFPLVIGKVGDPINPKGIVFSTALSGKLISSEKLNSQEIITSDLATNAIRTISERQIVGVTTLNEEETITVTADQFFGDGSNLTGINTINMDVLNSTNGFYKLKESSLIDPVPEIINDSIMSHFFDPSYINDNFHFYLGLSEFDWDQDGLIDDNSERYGTLNISDVNTRYVNTDYLDSNDINTDYLYSNEIEFDQAYFYESIYFDGFGSIAYLDNNSDLVIQANKFIGDGSGLTDIVPSIETNSISSEHIMSETIRNEDIASDAGIAFSKLYITRADIEGLDISMSDGSIYNSMISEDTRIDFNKLNITSSDILGLGIGGLYPNALNTSLGDDNFGNIESAFSNIALGNRNLINLVNGIGNIGIGESSLKKVNGSSSNPSVGRANIGIGHLSGSGITSGSYNIAIGAQSLRETNDNFDFTGSENIAIGFGAGSLYNSDYQGNRSIFIGGISGPLNIDSYGIAIGYNAKIDENGLSLGENSSAFGLGSIAMGYNTYASADYSVAIGYQATNTTANTIQLGAETSVYKINSVRNIVADTYFKTFNTTSDVRLKKNIVDLKNANTLLDSLRPVAYQKRSNLESDDYSKVEYGFIAQEVQNVLPELITDTGGKDNILVMNYNGVIAVLTKALQEQKKEIEELKKQVNYLMSKE